MTGRSRATGGDMRAVLLVAVAGFAGFGTFYGLYTAAPAALAVGGTGAGARIGFFMTVVILVQPFVPMAGRYLRVRARVVLVAMAAMAVGFGLLPLGGAWVGLAMIGLGFGVFVVTATAWVRELAGVGQVGRALGIFGFASAVGGTLGAPAALALADAAGTRGVAVGGALLVGLGLIPVLAVRLLHARPTPETQPLIHDDGTDGSSAAATAPPTPGPPPITDVDISRSTPLEPPPVPAPSPRWSAPVALAASLAVHLFAVLAYGLVLSSADGLSNGTVPGSGSGPGAGAGSAQLAIAVAFVVQAAVAFGRPAAGWLSDRWSAAGTAAVAGAGVAVSVVAAALSDGAVAVLVSAGLVGLSSGAVQTAALTLMMQRAHTAAGYERASTVWNMSFDVALAVAAVAAARFALF